MASTVAGLVQVIQGSGVFFGGISPKPLPPKPPDRYITVSKTLGEELESLDGPSGLAETIMQVDCWSPNYETADELRESIKAYMLGFSGAAGSSGLVIDACNHRMDAELYNDTLELHQHIIRFNIWWEAA